MFKVSQEIHFKPDFTQNNTFDYDNNNLKISDANIQERVEIKNFPVSIVSINSEINFQIHRNSNEGIIDVQIENQSGIIENIPVQKLDSNRLNVKISPITEGLHKVHIKLNNTKLPESPLIFSAQKYMQHSKSQTKIPDFRSDSGKVRYSGGGLEKIQLHDKNYFTVDASTAGNNILFVGICGPKGQCDEVAIKHKGGNVYNVTYQIQDSGKYLIAVKWGEEHIPGSPFYLEAI